MEWKEVGGQGGHSQTGLAGGVGSLAPVTGQGWHELRLAGTWDPPGQDSGQVGGLFSRSFFFFLFAAPSMAYGGSQARDRIRAVPQPRQCQIEAASVTYTAAYGTAGSLTH